MFAVRQHTTVERKSQSIRKIHKIFLRENFPLYGSLVPALHQGADKVVFFNPLQAILNFIRKRSVPKFIQNGGVRKSPYITAATFCAFFKLECWWRAPWSFSLYERMDFERFHANWMLWTHSLRKKKVNMLYVRWRMRRASIYHWTQLVVM